MNIAIIGGGPAGLMSAFFAKTEQNQVVIFEKNEKLGKKLYITGKGRCNVTNEKCVGQEFLDNIVTNPKFMYSAISLFDYHDTVKFFEYNGCKLKVERGGRVFPVSDKASDITKALTNAVMKKGVEVRQNSKIDYIVKQNDVFIITCDNQKFEFDKIIIATGGKSYPTTGSTGDGYKFAKAFGHNIIDTKPSLVAIPLTESYVKQLEGLSLKNVELKLKGKKSEIASFFGEALFTDKEISGPIALSMSAKIQKIDENYDLYLDFKPYITAEELELRIIKEFNNGLNREIQNALKELMPARFVGVLLNYCKIQETKKLNSITKEERQNLVYAIKNFKLNYRKSNDFERAVVTTGGVDVKEINSKTMESKLVSGLYFAGEVIDVDAYTGGFNIQIALSTGALAGNNAKGEDL